MRTLFLSFLLAPLLVSTAGAPLAAPQGISFPPALQQRLKAEPPRRGFHVVRSVRPPFLAGDFDGRGRTEYAVQIEGKDRTSDVLFYLADGKTRRLTRDIGHNWPGPEWKLFRKGSRVPVRGDVNENPHPGALAGDAIVLARPESSSALVYWRNGGFHIYWLSD